jgi:hypothetical protein
MLLKLMVSFIGNWGYSLDYLSVKKYMFSLTLTLTLTYNPNPTNDAG